VRTLVLFALVACAPRQTVVKWASTSASVHELIEIKSDGYADYIRTLSGVAQKPESLELTRTQVNELGEMFRSEHACELTTDPSYVPAPGEGKTSLELTFPDQQCKVELWNLEWQRGKGRDIAETMQSMRPTRLLRAPLRAPK
jgi:hypothetical protein